MTRTLRGIQLGMYREAYLRAQGGIPQTVLMSGAITTSPQGHKAPVSVEDVSESSVGSELGLGLGRSQSMMRRKIMER